MWQKEISIQAPRKGLNLITPVIKENLPGLPENGMLNVFIQHTSASLLIQENADPSARRDLETFLEKLCPENQSWHTHTLEGPDDTTSHLKSALTTVSLNVPICNHDLSLGTWQGIYLWEHRDSTPRRKLILSLWS